LDRLWKPLGIAGIRRVATHHRLDGAAVERSSSRWSKGTSSRRNKALRQRRRRRRADVGTTFSLTFTTVRRRACAYSPVCGMRACYAPGIGKSDDTDREHRVDSISLLDHRLPLGQVQVRRGGEAAISPIVNAEAEGAAVAVAAATATGVPVAVAVAVAERARVAADFCFWVGFAAFFGGAF
jgi:hypothetical protein